MHKNSTLRVIRYDTGMTGQYRENCGRLFARRCSMNYERRREIDEKSRRQISARACGHKAPCTPDAEYTYWTPNCVCYNHGCIWRVGVRGFEPRKR